ncbi:hypothetical protein JOQ06_015456, partial [Pogonophryne albipinna]
RERDELWRLLVVNLSGLEHKNSQEQKENREKTPRGYLHALLVTCGSCTRKDGRADGLRALKLDRLPRHRQQLFLPPTSPNPVKAAAAPRGCARAPHHEAALATAARGSARSHRH